MNKNEIFNQLKEETKISNLKAPSKIDFEIDIKTQTLLISIDSKLAAKDNMQKDHLAFESWMLSIIASKIFAILKVKLSWDSLDIPTPHYNRFKFRVIKCLDYFDWFDVDNKCKLEIDNFRAEYNNEKFVLNYPNKEASENAENKESFLEREFIKHKELYKGIAFKDKNHQLPVGVFKGEKSRNSLFFTGGKSAIDLWGFKDDEFWIFELKYANKMIGIITELLFYMWLCEDVFIKHHIEYDDMDNNIKKSRENNYRSFDQLYSLSKNGIKKIHGVMLYDDNSLHPLIRKSAVVEYINTYFTHKNLTVLEQSYRTKSTLIELL